MEPLPDPEGELRRGPGTAHRLALFGRGRPGPLRRMRGHLRHHPGRCPTRSFCRPMLRILEEAGIPREGRHHPHRHRYAPAQRRCGTRKHGGALGPWTTTVSSTTSAATGSTCAGWAPLAAGPLELNTIYLDADLKILTGPHRAAHVRRVLGGAQVRPARHLQPGDPCAICTPLT